MNAAAALTYRVIRSSHPKPAAEREAILANPGFGVHFTDHMVAIDWDKDTGWHDARVQPTARSRSTRPPQCCTTARRSSRA